MKSKVKLNDFNPNIGLDRGASKIKEAIWYIVKIIFFLSSLPFPYSLKRKLLITFGAKIGKNVIIKPRVNIHFPWKLEIGNNVWIGEEVFILNFEKLKIGNNVCISQRSFLCGGNHDYKEASMPYRNGPITLFDGSWIGASCFIAPKVTIGVDCVVTAGSIVTTSLPKNSIYSGNPAKFVRGRWN